MKTILAIASLWWLHGAALSVAAPAASSPAYEPTEARYLELSVANASQTVQLEAGVDYVIHFVNADTSSAPFATLFLSRPIALYAIQKYPDLGVLEVLPKRGAKGNGFLIVAPQ